MANDDLESALGRWKNTLCREIDVGGLFSRSKIAHKWKAPWRAILLREAVAWRLQDLLEQSRVLHEASHVLGARILLRSGFETVAILIYSNKSIRRVIAGDFDFHEFSEQTSRLLLGSRDKTTRMEAINILTVLRNADQRYPGLDQWYAALSESAHPNFEGLLFGYSIADEQSHLTTFSNRWENLYGKHHLESINACMNVFNAEYNHEWPSAFEALERWLEQNDSTLEATRPSKMKGLEGDN